MNLLPMLCGAIVALMIYFNGKLTEYYGAYVGTVLIHAIGLVVITAIVLLKKEKFLPGKKLPLYLFTGGAIGVATTVFNNLAFGAVSLTAILALSLLGQSVASLGIDQLGLFSMPRQAFHAKKLIGYFFVTIGIVLLIVM